MKVLLLIIPFLTALTGLAAGIIKERLFVFNRKRKRENAYQILKEVIGLNLDEEFKAHVLEEYKRLVIHELKGFEVSSEQFKMIEDSRISNKFSNYQIKIAEQYFKYDKDKLEVKISGIQKFIFVSFFLVAVTLISIAFYLIFIIEGMNNWKIYFTIMGFAIITLLSGYYLVKIFVAPVNIAHLIKKELKK